MRLQLFRQVLIPILLSTALAGCTATVFTPSLRVPILMYHYISGNPHAPSDPLRTRLSVPPAQFAQQLAYLQRAGYTTITLGISRWSFHDNHTHPGRADWIRDRGDDGAGTG